MKDTDEKELTLADKEKRMLAEGNLRRDFYITAAKMGLKVLSAMSDDKCCRLLAWLYVYGAAHENVIYGRLSGAVFYAQGRLNLFGGEIPNAELLPILRGYIKDIDTTDIDKHNDPPEWVVSLEQEFGLKPHREKPRRKEEMNDL
jgi:hypothetical protein